jgi:hypothetical protein
MVIPAAGFVMLAARHPGTPVNAPSAHTMTGFVYTGCHGSGKLEGGYIAGRVNAPSAADMFGCLHNTYNTDNRYWPIISQLDDIHVVNPEGHRHAWFQEKASSPSADKSIPFSLWLPQWEGHRESEGSSRLLPTSRSETFEYQEKSGGDIDEAHSDLLSEMLASASQDCRRRASAIRASLKSQFKGQRLRDELILARRRASAERRHTLAQIRRDFGHLRGSRRKRRRILQVSAHR